MGLRGQLLPPQLNLQQFQSDQTRFLKRLEETGLDVKLYASAFNPYPFAVTRAQLEQWGALQISIHRAILAVVENFSADVRIRDVITLPAAEQKLLHELADHPYRAGGFRPDFLHAADGTEKITEINARFPINGFLSSALLNRCVESPLPQLAELPDAMTARLGESGTVGIIKSSEPGWDINLLQTFLGGRCEMVAPSQLTKTMLDRWRSVLVELHQQELLEQVPTTLRMPLARHPGLLNDLRTILIVHDKRLLSLLSTSEILADYLSVEDLARLRGHIVPTWVKGLSPEKVGEAFNQTEGWLAKPPRSGKGQGILVSSQMPPTVWREKLSALPDDWLLQPYVEQREFPIAVLQNNQVTSVSMRVVGILPQLDDKTFGAGMFRAAADTIVNVARGGLILTPTLVEEVL